MTISAYFPWKRHLERLPNIVLTFRFVWRTAPQTLSGSCGVSSSPLGPPGAAPPVPAWKSEGKKICLGNRTLTERRRDTRGRARDSEARFECVCLLKTVAVTTEAFLKASLRGGGVQVGQSHVRGVLRRRQFIHGRNEPVCVFLHVVQEAEHADVGADAHAELRFGVAVVLRAVLFLLRETKCVNYDQHGCTVAPPGSSDQQGAVWGGGVGGGIDVSRRPLWIISSPRMHFNAGY